MKKGLWIFALILVIVLLALFLTRRPRPEEGVRGPERPREVLYASVFREACRPVEPSRGGPAWLEDAEFAALRAEWRNLGPADSTLMEKLVLDWMHPASQEPYRLTNVSQAQGGAGKPITDRLALGEKIVEHPRWRAGSMRNYPAAAVVLTSHEKSVLQYLGRDGRDEPHTRTTLRDVLRIPAAELDAAVENLASVGWLRETGAGDSAAYAAADTAIASTGGLSYLTFTPSQGRSFDVASFSAVLRRNPRDFKEGRVKLSGSCAETGRSVALDIALDKFLLGRPGQAYAAEILTPGLSNGLFAGDKAWERWLRRHPNASVGAVAPVISFYQRVMGG